MPIHSRYYLGDVLARQNLILITLPHPPPTIHYSFLLPPLPSLQQTAAATSTVPPHLILLIGLPGSGKSTVAKHLLQDCCQRQLISTDAIRAQVFGNEAIQGAWLKVWRQVEAQFRQTTQQILAGEASEVIFDATNAVRKQRRETISLARNCGFVSITGLWLNTPLELCLERNQARDRQVPLSVILAMHRRLIGAPPSLEEGLDRLIQVKGRG